MGHALPTIEHRRAVEIGALPANMSQNPYSSGGGRPGPGGAGAGDDLDALVESIMGEDPSGRAERSEGSGRAAGRQRVEMPVEERGARQPDRGTNDLQAQIRSIALRVQALSEANANQVTRDNEIKELRQAMREVLIATHKQTSPSAIYNAEVQLPVIQIKLVMLESVNLLHQADTDAATLGHWAMLFGGVMIGALLGIAFAFFFLYNLLYLILGSVAVFALFVSLVFTFLARQARKRAVSARRTLDESTLTRTIANGIRE